MKAIMAGTGGRAPLRRNMSTPSGEFRWPAQTCVCRVPASSSCQRIRWRRQRAAAVHLSLLDPRRSFCGTQPIFSGTNHRRPSRWVSRSRSIILYRSLADFRLELVRRPSHTATTSHELKPPTTRSRSDRIDRFIVLSFSGNGIVYHGFR